MSKVKFSVFYPATEGASFDHDYYRDSHVPLCVKTWSPSGVEIDKGLDGPHVAAVHFVYDSLEVFQAAMAAEGTAGVLADVPNYTSITPFTELSEVV